MAQRRTKFDVKREATHRALLDAGMQVFAEKGYSASRIDDIVERTGQTKGAFYFHFRNKLDLLQQVVRHRAELRKDWWRVPERLDRSVSIADAIRAALADATARSGVSGWVLVMVDAFRQHQDDPEVRALFRADYDQWIEEVVGLVEVLKAGGWVETDAPVRELATQLFATGEGFLVHAALYGLTDDGPLYRAFEQILNG